MDLLSARELELEALLRLRDSQLAQLSDEVAHLRQFLPSKSGPSATDPVTLPPPLVSLLLPHITSSSSDAASASGTVTAALTQRAQLLQEENDELYEVLKQGETGKLKEEVHGLRRAVDRLEKALRQSHQVIETLSAELEKSYSTFLASARPPTQNAGNNKGNSHSPRNSYHHLPRETHAGNGSHGSKLPPTGPRAHKKPRLEPRASTPSRSSGSQSATREYASRHDSHYRPKNLHPKMYVDHNEQRRTTPPPLERVRERDRERKDRDRERGDREGRNSRRNGNFSGAGRGGGARRGDRTAISSNFSGDRTLAERLGL